jgi:hypothetical protein
LAKGGVGIIERSKKEGESWLRKGLDRLAEEGGGI